MAGLHKRMHAARLRHVVSIQAAQKVQDPASGEMVREQWIDLYTGVRAEIVDASAREFFGAQAEQRETGTRITMRWMPGINPGNRVVDENGVKYNISGVLADPDSRREWLTLACTSGVRAEGQ